MQSQIPLQVMWRDTLKRHTHLGGGGQTKEPVSVSNLTTLYMQSRVYSY